MTRASVLFVDNDPKSLEAYRLSLQPMHQEFAVRLESCSRQAWDLAQTERIDLIVANVELAGFDGWQLLQRFRQSDRLAAVPFVLVADYIDGALYDLAISMGAYDFLAKPLQREVVFSTVRNGVRLRRAEETLAQNADGDKLDLQRQVDDLYLSRLDMLWRLGKAAEFRDEETGNHVIRVGCYSRLMAEEMGMPATFVEDLFLAAPLHDIGKIAVPEHVLRKPGSLDSSEWTVMYQHCEIGEAILDRETSVGRVAARFGGPAGNLESNSVLEMARLISRCHHEKWDGTGYPNRLAGQDIPVAARIVAVADVYDALRSKRPYKDSVPINESLQIITENSGTHFDPQVVAAFVKVFDEIKSVENELVDRPAFGGLLPARKPAFKNARARTLLS